MSKKLENEEPELQAPDEVSMYQPESFDDEFESSGLLTDSKYEVPETSESFIDTGEGKIINKDEMTPFQIIKSLAQQNNQEVKDPKKNCKYCHERGYEGLDAKTKMPIPCRCLFRGKSENEKMEESLYDSEKNQHRISREQKRRMSKFFTKQMKLIKKVSKEEEKEVTNAFINKLLKKYIQIESIKKTADFFNITETKTKKIIKENKVKLEKLKNKKGE